MRTVVKHMLGAVHRDQSGHLGTYNKVPRALAFVRGGSKYRKAALRGAKLAGLTVTVAQTLCGSLDDGSYLDVSGPATLLGPFLDGPLVSDWDWCMDAREPGYIRAPSFGSPGRGPHRDNGQSIPSVRELERREGRKELTAADANVGRVVNHATTVGAFRKPVTVTRGTDNFFLYVNDQPLLGGETVAAIARKASKANIDPDATLSIVAADGTVIEL